MPFYTFGSALKSTLPSAAFSSPPPPAAHPSMLADSDSSLPAAAHTNPEHAPVPAPRKRFAVPAPPLCPPVPAPRQCLLVPALPECPPVSTPPERPQVPALPERKTEPASTSPKEFFWGGSRVPAIEAGSGAGAMALEVVSPWPPESQDLPLPPEFLDPPWPPEFPCRPASRAPPPRWIFYGAGCTCWGGGADVYDHQSRSPSPGALITEHRHLSSLIKSTSPTHSSCTVIVYSLHCETNIAMCYLPDSPAIVYLLVVPVFRSPFSTGLHHFCDPPSPRSIVPIGSPGIGNRTCYTQMRLSWTLQFPAHSPGFCTLLHSTVCHQSINLLLFALNSVSRVNNTYSFNQE